MNFRRDMSSECLSAGIHGLSEDRDFLEELKKVFRNSSGRLVEELRICFQMSSEWSFRTNKPLL